MAVPNYELADGLCGPLAGGFCGPPAGGPALPEPVVCPPPVELAVPGGSVPAEFPDPLGAAPVPLPPVAPVGFPDEPELVVPPAPEFGRVLTGIVMVTVSG
jgi:hypothetical protein